MVNRGRAAERRPAERKRVRRIQRVTRGHVIRRTETGAYVRMAGGRMRRFRRASRLAITMTAVLLLVWESMGAPADGGAEPASDPSVAMEEATTTIRDLLVSFYGILPKVAIAAGVLLFAYLISRLAKLVFKRVLGNWSRAAAASALLSLALFFIAVGIALSVVAGDARALVGSLGLVGLALSWALQTPIESFTGWLLNSFKGYYRVGDRIEVGDVFGDVYRIDVLTTTLWEAGGPGKPVQAAQPTGALVTVPNSEVLRANIINYTRDFPFVWDEITVGIANESDLGYALTVLQKTATVLIGSEMTDPVKQYAQLLQERGLSMDVAVEPTVYVVPTDAWLNLTLRYLVQVRQRRKWATNLHVGIAQEFAKPEHGGKIITAYPRTQVQVLQSGPPSD